VSDRGYDFHELSLCGEDELPFAIEFYDDYLLVQGDRLDRVE